MSRDRVRGAVPPKVMLAALAVLAVAPYVNAFRLPFIWEDYKYIANNAFVHSLSNLRVLWGSPMVSMEIQRPYFRPWLITSDIVNWALGGGQPWTFHVTNVLLHAGVTLLLAKLLLTLTRPACAYLAAALFAVHPIHTESVTRIDGRSDPWCALFMLIAFLLFITARDRRRPYLWIGGAAVAYFMALLSKEMALPLPFLLLLWEGSGVPTLRGPAFRRALRRHVPLWLVAVAYVVIRIGIVGAGQTPTQVLGDSRMDVVLLMTGVVVLYLRLLVWPLGLSIFHNMPFAAGVLDPRFLLNVGLLAGVTAVAWRWWRRRPLVLLAWIAFFGLLSPVLNIFPLTDPVSERFLYIPSAAFCLMVAVVLEPLVQHPGRSPAYLRVGRGAVAAVVLLLALLTAARNRDYVNDYQLAKRAAEVGDKNPHARHNFGHFAHLRNELDVAEREYRAAIAIDPGFVMPWDGLIEVYAARGAPAQALAAVEMALRLQPENPRFHVRRGDMLLALGRADDAVAAYQTAARLLPGRTRVRWALVRALRAADRDAEARRVCAAPVRPGADPEFTARLEEECAALSP